LVEKEGGKGEKKKKDGGNDSLPRKLVKAKGGRKEVRGIVTKGKKGKANPLR